MDIPIKTTRMYSRKNKDRRGDLFRTNKKKVERISPRMGWFCASGPVEIIYIRWPFIMWWSKEGQVDWLINFTKCRQLKIIQKINFFVGITDKRRKYIIHPEFMVANHKIADQFIQNLKSNPNKLHDLTGEMKRSLKQQRLVKSIKMQIHKIKRIEELDCKESKKTKQIQ